MKRRGSYVKAFPTATRPFDVGIVEHKLAGKFRFNKIHLRAEQRQLSLLLYEHSHAWRTNIYINDISVFTCAIYIIYTSI